MQSILDDLNNLLTEGNFTPAGLETLREKYGFVASTIRPLIIEGISVPVASLTFPVPEGGQHLEDFVDGYAKDDDVYPLYSLNGKGYLVAGVRGPIFMIEHGKTGLTIGIPTTVVSDYLDDIDKALGYVGSGAYGKNTPRNPDTLMGFLGGLNLDGI